MKSYQVKYYLHTKDEPYSTERIFNAGSSVDLANALLDEIVHFRGTGKKSALMLQIECEFLGYFKQTSSSVIEIRVVQDDRVRIVGGAYDMVAKVKAKRALAQVETL